MNPVLHNTGTSGGHFELNRRIVFWIFGYLIRLISVDSSRFLKKEGIRVTNFNGNIGEEIIGSV